MKKHSTTTSLPNGKSREAKEKRKNSVLLGYDWAAAIVDDSRDVGSRAYLDERDEDLGEIRAFRQSHASSCVGASTVDGIDREMRDLGPVADFKTTDVEPRPRPTPVDNHICVFPFEISERLFARPLQTLGKKDSSSACAVCSRPRPTPSIEPSFVKVSLSRGRAAPPYIPRPHRRNSFDPSDSLSLAAHLLQGWRPRGCADAMPVTKSLALRRNLRKREEEQENNDGRKVRSSKRRAENF